MLHLLTAILSILSAIWKDVNIHHHGDGVDCGVGNPCFQQGPGISEGFIFPNGVLDTQQLINYATTTNILTNEFVPTPN